VIDNSYIAVWKFTEIECGIEEFPGNRVIADNDGFGLARNGPNQGNQYGGHECHLHQYFFHRFTFYLTFGILRPFAMVCLETRIDR
jgi:hypothetical protein